MLFSAPKERNFRSIVKAQVDAAQGDDCNPAAEWDG
jgi:hypothetical protein